MQGFSEVLTWILCSHDDNFANVSREDTGNSAAVVANPSCTDVQVVRSSLLPGVLKAWPHNRSPIPLPAQLKPVRTWLHYMCPSMVPRLLSLEVAGARCHRTMCS
jgi:hypothetical protein